MPDSLRTVFAGTTDFSAYLLQALLRHATDRRKQELVAVITTPDKAAGRGMSTRQNAVKRLHRHICGDLPLYQPQGLRAPDALEWLAGLRADLMVVVAYGVILPEACLQIPRYGCINVHTSLLPRWRGSAPIERAIIAGDKRTGVTIMQMDSGVDSGGILLQDSCSISATEDAGSLEGKLMPLAKSALLQVMDTLADKGPGGLKPVAQAESKMLMAAKIEKHEQLLDWREDAGVLERRIRALSRRGYVRLEYAGPPALMLKIVTARRIAHETRSPPGTVLSSDANGVTVACARDALVLKRLQIPGKAHPLDIAELRNGHKKWFSDGGIFSTGTVISCRNP